MTTNPQKQTPAAGEAEHTTFHVAGLVLDDGFRYRREAVYIRRVQSDGLSAAVAIASNPVIAGNIVRACNSHAELTANLQAERLAKARLLMQNAKLVAALGDMMALASELGGETAGNRVNFAQARAALQSAKE